jgi:hypothetical protein
MRLRDINSSHIMKVILPHRPCFDAQADDNRFYKFDDTSYDNATKSKREKLERLYRQFKS